MRGFPRPPRALKRVARADARRGTGCGGAARAGCDARAYEEIASVHVRPSRLVRITNSMAITAESQAIPTPPAVKTAGAQDA